MAVGGEPILNRKIEAAEDRSSARRRVSQIKENSDVRALQGQGADAGGTTSTVVHGEGFVIVLKSGASREFKSAILENYKDRQVKFTC